MNNYKSNSINGYCSACDKKVDSIMIDMGVGHVEYWGAPYNHESWEKVSPCCEETVIPENEYKYLIKNYVLYIYEKLKHSLDSKSSYKISEEIRELLKESGYNANLIKGFFVIESDFTYNRKCFEHFWVQIDDIIIDLSCYKFNNSLKNKLDMIVVDFKHCLDHQYFDGEIFK